jgi:hypothetical protein
MTPRPALPLISQALTTQQLRRRVLMQLAARNGHGKAPKEAVRP